LGATGLNQYEPAEHQKQYLLACEQQPRDKDFMLKHFIGFERLLCSGGPASGGHCFAVGTYDIRAALGSALALIYKF